MKRALTAAAVLTAIAAGCGALIALLLALHWLASSVIGK